MSNSRIQVPLPDWAKKKLESLSEDTSIPQASLISMAAISLIDCYMKFGISTVLTKLLEFHPKTEDSLTQVSLSSIVRKQLEEMKKESRFPQKYLLSMAIIVMLNNYQKNSFGIFGNLLDIKTESNNE